MRITKIFAISTLAAVAAAQDPILVNAAGNALPMSSFAYGTLALAQDGHVYASLDASLPSGYYYIDILDATLAPLNLLPVVDRTFYAQNNGAAGFSITRISSSPSLPPLGLGLGGVGQSMPVFPHLSPDVAGFNCIQKVLLRTLPSTWDPTQPFPGSVAFTGYQYFRIGDGSLGSVSGHVFEDVNQNGTREATEAGVPGCAIKFFVDDVELASTSTDANGNYTIPFTTVYNGECRVVLELNSQLYVATTPTDVTLAACTCANSVVNFGKYTVPQQCNGHTIGYWRNCHGISIIQNGSFWDELVALNLVNGCGQQFNPTGSVLQWRCWLMGANAWNMAYMLSAQLAAMQLNVLSGGVGLNCWVSTSQGPMQIGQVMAAANQALALDPWTPPCDPNRAVQQFLKNVLDAANNNKNWL